MDEVDAGGGLEYTDADGSAHRILGALSPNAKDSPNKIPSQLIAPISYPPESIKKSKKKRRSVNSASIFVVRRIKVGLLSSDFGIHPVATLIRGLIQFIDKEKVELFCFAIYPKVYSSTI